MVEFRKTAISQEDMAINQSNEHIVLTVLSFF